MFRLRIIFQDAPYDSKESNGVMMCPELEDAYIWMEFYIDFARKQTMFKRLNVLLSAESPNLEFEEIIQKYGQTYEDNLGNKHISTHLPSLRALETTFMYPHASYQYRVGPTPNTCQEGLRQIMPYLFLTLEKE